MLSNNNFPLIVENGYNTSYIDTLFMALFYKTSYIQDMLSENVTNVKFYYLQDLIYFNFVRKSRCGYTIDSQIMNEIRNYLFYCGWKHNYNITDLFNVNELYDYLADNFNIKKIEFISENKKINMNYITLDVFDNSSVKILLDNYINNTIGTNMTFSEVPKFISIFLDRKDTTKLYFVDIMEGICFSTNNDPEQQTKLWKINSIICYTKTNGGHYYSIIQKNKEWYLFTNNKLPSLMKIDLKDSDISQKIKQECVFMTYLLNSSK